MTTIMKRASAALKRKTPGAAEARQIDFDELPSYVGYQVRRTQAKIFAEFEATLGDLDFTPGSFGVLTLIRANPGHHPGGAGGGVRRRQVDHEPGDRSPGEARARPARGAGERPALPCALSARRRPSRCSWRRARRSARFEAGVAARLTKAEQRELSRLLGKLQGRAEGQ